ncbi:uncharacterized protein [Diadema antillarum]|uniref:uncharacterized protein n=1 Tax=Diadema antillarum TaxID=105358 RepID=UPI003A8B0010
MEQHSAVHAAGTQEFLEHLSLVLDILGNSEKSVIDDTSLQRLLEYCKDVFNAEDIVANKDGLQLVFNFLENAIAVDVDSFEPSTLTFALRLTAVMSSNHKLFGQLMMSTKDSMSSSGILYSTHKMKRKLLFINNTVLVRLLTRGRCKEAIREPSVQGAWLKLLHAISRFDEFLALCRCTDAFNTALTLLGDTSMFVVTAAQQLLAKILIKQYQRKGTIMHTSSRLSQGNGSLIAGGTFVAASDDDELPIKRLIRSEDDGSPGKMGQQGLPWETSGGGRKRELDDADQAGGDPRGKGEAVDTGGIPKRAKVGEESDDAVLEAEEEENIQGLMMSEDAAKVLEHLLMDLDPLPQQGHPHIYPLPVNRPMGEKRMLSSIGVFRVLLESQDEMADLAIALALMDDIAMETRCQRLLGKDGSTSQTVCERVAEVLALIIRLKCERCNLAAVQDCFSDVCTLPRDLLGRGFVRPAGYLASEVLKCIDTVKERFPQSRNTDTQRAMLSVLLCPLRLTLSRGPDGAEYFGDERLDDLSSEMLLDEKTASTLIPTSLSALESLLTKNPSSLCPFVPQILRLTIELLSGVTPDTDTAKQSTTLLLKYRSLTGSRKVTLAAIAVLKGALSSTTPSQSDAEELAEILTRILTNPDADYMVVLKGLSFLPDVVSVAMPTKESGVDPDPPVNRFVELGYSLQKKMCDIEWEIRDSAIVCVKQLLHLKSGAVTEWIRGNNLHRRLWESLVDGESYVRASSVTALPALVACPELWLDVCSVTGVTQADMINTLTGIIKTDSEAFARRAALDCLVLWLQEEKWMRDSINASISKATRHGTPGETCDARTAAEESLAKNDSIISQLGTDCLTVQAESQNMGSDGNDVQNQPTRSESHAGCSPETTGDVVLDAVAIAARDLDWEMKLEALKFYEHLLTLNIPGLIFPSASPRGGELVASGTSTSREKLKEASGDRLDDRGDVRIKEHEKFLSSSGILKMLIGISKDEDVSVSSRACVMLHHLKETLMAPVPGGEKPGVACGNVETGGSSGSQSVTREDGSCNGGTCQTRDGEDSRGCVDEEAQDTDPIGQLFDSDWTALLEHREAETVEGPVSLMLDIISAAEDRDENLLDCY